MIRPRYRSIRTRLMAWTGLLVATVVGAVVWTWASSTRDLYLEETRRHARSLAPMLAHAHANEFDEENWAQLRTNLDQVMKFREELIYISVSDVHGRTQVSTPRDFEGQIFPEIVPAAVTDAALRPGPESRIAETHLLRDVRSAGEERGRRGERVIEAAADIVNSDRRRVGVLRVGVSLRPVDRAVRAAVARSLALGGLALLAGLGGAFVVAKRLTEPVRRLQASAEKIAGGELGHRAEVEREDELGALAAAFNDMSSALRRSFDRLERTVQSFQRFVPRKFLSVIARAGIENIEVGVSARRTIAILFADIRGYTALSESMTGSEVFEFLNEYLGCMGKTVGEQGGFIDKYIGDAIMALFDEPSTDAAVRAALAMRRTLGEFNASRRERGKAPIDVGIGVHSGEVVMGTVGFTSRIDSTVVGDAVNVAARIESLTKDFACPILVSEAVVRALADPKAFELRLVDSAAKVKGKQEAIAVYEVRERDGR